MFKWKEEFSCFNREMDMQHKKLLELITSLYDIVKLKDNYDHYDEIAQIFKELSEYTVYHFGYEEELFDKYNYDSINKKLHKLEHKSFINKVSAIDLDEMDENQRGMSIEVVMFVAKWVEEHILETDRKFGRFMKELGV